MVISLVVSKGGCNLSNTYRHKGLPPGPICNPGRQAIEAVLDLPMVSWLYFVGRGDGTSQFQNAT